MPKTRQQKTDTVQKLTDKLGQAKSVVFTDYKGLNMTELSNLRDKLREGEAEFSVTKNSLLKLALGKGELKLGDEQVLEGPTATLFSFGDEISPIKTLVKTLKDSQKGAVKGGFLFQEYLNQYQINKLAQLPSKDELRAKVVGGLGAPLYGLVGVLQANLRNLVYTLEQIRALKGGV